MQGWEFDLSIFSIFKKIDCDWSQKTNDSIEKKTYFLSVFENFPPFYAQRSNRSRQSSIFFKDRHDRIDHKKDRSDQKNWWSNSQPCPFVIDTNKGDSVNNFVSLPLHVLKKTSNGAALKACCGLALIIHHICCHLILLEPIHYCILSCLVISIYQ